MLALPQQKDRLVGFCAPEPAVVLRAAKLTRRFSEVACALREVDLDVAKGEFLGLMGRSGSGKSTLLHLLAGLDTPTSGEVWFDGARLEDRSETERARVRRRAMGFVFQGIHLVPDLTLLENVLVVGALVAHDRRELRGRAEALLDALGVGALADRLPAQLSGGEQQRGALARAVVNAPAVLFADEPTGALDSTSGAALLALLERLHAQGQTIVLATHDLAAARRADRVVFMRDGALVGELRLAELEPGTRERALREWLAREGW